MKNIIQENDLWEVTFKELGVIFNILWDYGVTSNHLAMLRANPDYAKQVAEFMLRGGIESSASKYPPISPGTAVRTTHANWDLRDEWTDEGLTMREWGVQGKVLTHHDSHGLCYDVRHEDGTVGCYDPSELEIVQ